jgi:hypothetical protein
VNVVPFFLLGGAALALLIAFAEPRERPAPKVAWTALGIALIVIAMFPAALLLVILGLAFVVMLRTLRRQY